jgi:5'-3' exonuclease
LCEDYEADDGMAIAQADKLTYDSVGSPPDNFTGEFVDGSQTVICSRDKDLKMVPGYHYSWGAGKQKEVPTRFISEEEGNKWFFTQLLMGDATDNIPGLYRVGQKNAEKLLDGLSEPLDLYSVCQHQYAVRFGSYWKLFLHENARLLWMMQSEDDDIRDWLEGLEGIRSKVTNTEEGY